MVALAAAPLVPYIHVNIAQAAETKQGGAVASAPAASAPVFGNPDLKQFLLLSQVLTNRAALDPVTADRALKNLTAEDSGFPAQADALFKAITEAKFTDMRTFNTFIGRHPALRPAAMKIISAWYLGYTGTPSGNSDQDDARFVAFAGALMYQPTIDATVVPTYSRGHTNYWSQPPATLATD